MLPVIFFSFYLLLPSLRPPSDMFCTPTTLFPFASPRLHITIPPHLLTSPFCPVIIFSFAVFSHPFLLLTRSFLPINYFPPISPLYTCPTFSAHLNYLFHLRYSFLLFSVAFHPFFPPHTSSLSHKFIYSHFSSSSPYLFTSPVSPVLFFSFFFYHFLLSRLLTLFTLPLLSVLQTFAFSIHRFPFPFPLIFSVTF